MDENRVGAAFDWVSPKPASSAADVDSDSIFAAILEGRAVQVVLRAQPDDITDLFVPLQMHLAASSRLIPVFVDGHQTRFSALVNTLARALTVPLIHDSEQRALATRARMEQEHRAGRSIVVLVDGREGLSDIMLRYLERLVPVPEEGAQTSTAVQLVFIGLTSCLDVLLRSKHGLVRQATEEAQKSWQEQPAVPIGPDYLNKRFSAQESHR